jgi:hypothetical protein
MPLTKGFPRHKDLPEIQWRNGGETHQGGRMSVLLDEKYMPYKVTSRYIAKFLAGHYSLRFFVGDYNSSSAFTFLC